MIGICFCAKTRGFASLAKFVGWRRAVPIYKEVVCFKSRYPVAEVKESRDLPWIQHTKDVFKREILWHRVVGILTFRFLLRRIGAPRLDWNDFSVGVAEAVKTVGGCVSMHDANDELKHYLGPTLLRQYKIAFEKLKFENKKIELNLEYPKKLHISGARFIFGCAEPGDEYVISSCGQKCIVSKSDMEELEEIFLPRIIAAYRFGKEYGKEALMKQIRFQIDVKFELVERYSLWDLDDNDYYSKSIDRTPINVFHRWRFESLIPPPSEVFRLDWMVIDIDDFLTTKYRIPEDTKNGK